VVLGSLCFAAQQFHAGVLQGGAGDPADDNTHVRWIADIHSQWYERAARNWFELTRLCFVADRDRIFRLWSGLECAGGVVLDLDAVLTGFL
jgi:hypothetical protein